MLKNKKRFFYPLEGSARRVIFGSGANILSEGIHAIKHIFLIPLFLRAWGKAVYGEWLTMYALAVYLSLVDVGMHNSILNRLTQSYSRGDLEQFKGIFQSALRMLLILIIIALTSFSFFIFLAPINKWLNINITDPKIFKYSLIILGVYFLCSLVSELFRNLYTSLGEYIRGAILYNFKEFILILFLAIMLIAKGNFIAISLLHLIPLFAMIFYYIWDINRRHAQKAQLTFYSADWKLSFSFMGTGLFFFLIVFGYALNIQGSILVIGNILGAGAVAVFSVHRTLVHSLIKIIGTVCYPLWPELTAAEAKEDYEKLQLIFSMLIKISLSVSFSLAVLLFFVGKDIIRIWTAGRVGFEPLLWILLLIYIPLRIFWSTCGLFQTATNRPRKLAISLLSSSVLGLMLAIIFTKMWGIVGTLIGFAIPEIIICVGITPHETLKIIKYDKKEFYLIIMGKGIMVALCELLIAYFIYILIGKSILQVIVLFFAIGSYALFAGYLFWLNAREKEALKSIFKLRACF